MEKNVLDFATALTDKHVEVSDEVYAELEKSFSDAQILELAHATIRSADRARLNRALDVQNDEVPEEAYCLVQDAREASRTP